jgi:HNH endonuclease
MTSEIDQIREILGKIEIKLTRFEENSSLRDFAALEIPEIISDVIDYLTPQLTPYQNIFYIYLLRHSIISSGTQYLRVSVRGLKGIVASPRSDASTGTSYGQVQKCLEELTEKGAIRKESEPNREGTLYKILIPEEIESCRIAMKEKINTPTTAVDIQKEVDYYNVRENRTSIFDRDMYKCRYCEKQLTRFTSTLDHIRPVSKGGGNEFDNVITACLDCNSRKTGKFLSDFYADKNPA